MVSKHTSPNSSVSAWSQDVISKCRHSILSVHFSNIAPGLQPLNHCLHIFKPMKLLLKFELALGPTNAPTSPHIPYYFYIPSPGSPCSGVFVRDLPTPVTIGLQEFYMLIGASSAPVIAHKSRLLDLIKNFGKQANLYAQEMSPQSL